MARASDDLASGKWSESLALLRAPNPFTIDCVGYGSNFRGWQERTPAEGYSWLQEAVKEGDIYAEQKLGLRLLDGDGLTPEPQKGLEVLQHAAESGNPLAMERLAAYLLSVESSSDARADAERWFRQAIANGSASAQLAFASRLLSGTGLTADPVQGFRLLMELAQRGHRMAHIKLGACFLAGWGVKQDREAALSWLKRIGCISATQISNIGMYVYLRSLALPKWERPEGAQEASVLFQEAVRQGHRISELNLVYLLRRGEIPSEGLPSLEALLAPHLREQNPNAVINQALRFARGVGCGTDWNAADILVGKLQSAAEAILIWWHARSKEGDAEGHLVTAWLCRHELVVDPDQMSAQERLDRARAGGWDAPNWIAHPVAAHTH